MARKKHYSAAEEAQVDMTPMLDIVFIMLIFFIVTTSFVKESGIEVNRPKAQQASKKPSANIFIAINEAGIVYMEKREVDIQRVRANVERMLAEAPEAQVMIQADQQAKHGIVVKVMDQVKAAGIDKISVSAEND
ncbi:outer membrane transport energization protein ExbD [Ferrimonas balearica DSM 9799]|uniref:Outer membrane transport energization protein ExbD n=1 Tax=Ferrimonas balearica (strain DSM 9799 / CCM 4581 / KCTC 23876 / PAT) TaxID=550540 RepID=E1SW88_FERBD|nr:biopolymer transporter ExbD [Ferrimonas balearica]MBY6018373.1 biopolymer transporter ExbD [Halomonas denitrificans]ADN75377.1 outer membrane transport energization protein ExbD [Ferrimonas balearica DSM 9799]MBW3138292.1 biopolymer transporter ExbD [Ferrimonas balearica]MBW3164160.1 biopolymer transporter ExbD [Ferrimonas balearica]MBY5979035.1 biopolymer transporter ExbD [Ferrimonas balearica]